MEIFSKGKLKRLKSSLVLGQLRLQIAQLLVIFYRKNERFLCIPQIGIPKLPVPRPGDKKGRGLVGEIIFKMQCYITQIESLLYFAYLGTL